MSDVDLGRFIRQLTGRPVVKPGGVPRCTTCGTFLADGAMATAYAYRLSDEATLTVARLYCETCDNRSVTHPTLGAVEVVVESTLVQVRERLVLSDLNVCDWSGKAAGRKSW